MYIFGESPLFDGSRMAHVSLCKGLPCTGGKESSLRQDPARVFGSEIHTRKQGHAAHENFNSLFPRQWVTNRDQLTGKAWTRPPLPE